LRARYYGTFCYRERNPAQAFIDRSFGCNGVVAEFEHRMAILEDMRIAIITESFPPDVNGVAHCVVRVAENLVRKGHHPLVIAPESSRAVADDEFPYPVERVPSVPLPGYPTFRLGLPTPRTRKAIVRHGTEVVHLASPVALGAWGARVARAEHLPMIAVYQTDLPSYARAYHLGRATEAFAWRWLRDIHNTANRTLAPSSMTAADLDTHGLERVWLWGRGVDTERFHPARRDDRLRAEIAPGGEVIVGYVGRLAIEKRVDLLAAVAALPGVKLAVTGGGPMEEELRSALPSAAFLGMRYGDDLARIYASLDVFVHTGPFDTFGQTIQEASASGLPVVAPASGGPLDLVDDGATGYLVSPGDPGELAAAVSRLAASPALRERLGEAARRRVLTRTWSALTDELLGHYAAVTGTDAVPARLAA
jgi:phosphatidylinositol alpha 1,6-mannosyltransferase